MPLATVDDLTTRLGMSRARRLFDDDNDGEADVSPLQRCVDDAIAKVKGFLDGVYDFTSDIDEDNPPPNIRRITVDVAHAYAAQRHPEVVTLDWTQLMDQADRDLKMLRPGKQRLGTGTPKASVSHGAAVVSSTTRGW